MTAEHRSPFDRSRTHQVLSANIDALGDRLHASEQTLTTLFSLPAHDDADDHAPADSQSPPTGRFTKALPKDPSPSIGPPPPLYTCGLPAGSLIDAACSLYTPAADGATRPLVFIEPDIYSARHALAELDLRAHLSAPRVNAFIGDDAVARLERWLTTRLLYTVKGDLLAARKDGPHHRVADAIRAAARHQGRQAARYREAVTRMYADMTPERWRSRFDGIVCATGDHQLRVLILTTRFSTYVQHAATDLANAFHETGADARLLIEPDAHSKLTLNAFLHQFHELKPDLVIAINYTRHQLRDAIPDRIPFLCWVQDPLPALFDPNQPPQGPLDFLVGHPHPEFRPDRGFDPHRVFYTPVLASRSKFAPPRRAAERPLERDIVVVTHQGEPPTRVREDLMQLAATPQLRDVFDAVLNEAERIVDRNALGSVRRTLHAAAAAPLQAHGLPTHRDAVEEIVRRVGVTYVDRLLRHQTVRWAADIAERRGWRFDIFGRGWDTSEFSRFARGPLEHSDELRDVYASSGASLHVMPGWFAHQRVYECALAGGVSIVRLTGDAILAMLNIARRHIDALATAAEGDIDAERKRQDNGRPPPDAAAIDHPDVAMLLRTLQAFEPLTHEDAEPLRHAMHSGRFRYPPIARPPGHNKPLVAPRIVEPFAVGDPAEFAFWSPELLETRLERAITDPAWRRAMTRDAQRRVQAAFTYECAAARIPAAIREQLPPATQASRSVKSRSGESGRPDSNRRHSAWERPRLQI